MNELLLAPCKKAICGGTTANIVARFMGTQVGVDLSSMDAKVPPAGTLEGIDWLRKASSPSRIRRRTSKGAFVAPRCTGNATGPAG